MSDLSDDEVTVLLIAAKGESMMPIGRWEAPVNSLVAKGLLRRHDKFNNVITDAGMKAAEKDEDDVARQMIEANNVVAAGKQQARASAEAIAVQLVDLAELSARTTGDDKVEALRKWARVILERALEKMQ